MARQLDEQPMKHPNSNMFWELPSDWSPEADRSPSPIVD